jgi:regulator of replication initiation timing
MNLENKESNVDHCACKPKSVEEAIGSHYALQVALQTMKERCQQLQQRLAAVEQENLRLRIDNRRRRSDSACTITADALTNESEDSKTRIDSLEEKVATLTRQKSRLTHHLFMVATENRQLWTRLSHLTQANQSLGGHLSKISNTLSRHHSTNSITVPKSESPLSSLSHRGELNLSSDSILSEESDHIAKKGTDTECDSVKAHSNSFARTSHGKCGFNFKCYGTSLVPNVHTLGIVYMFTPVLPI